MSLSYLGTARLRTNGPRVGIPFATVNANLGAQGANTTTNNNVTVTGVRVGDIVRCDCPLLEANLGIQMCVVGAPDTVTVQIINPTAAPIDPAAHDYTFWVIRGI